MLGWRAICEIILFTPLAPVAPGSDNGGGGRDLLVSLAVMGGGVGKKEKINDH